MFMSSVFLKYNYFGLLSTFINMNSETDSVNFYLIVFLLHDTYLL